MITVICVLRTLLHSVSAYAMCVDIDETAMWCASSRIAGASTMINAVQPCRDDQGSHHHSGDEPLHEDMPGDGPDEPQFITDEKAAAARDIEMQQVAPGEQAWAEVSFGELDDAHNPPLLMSACETQRCRLRPAFQALCPAGLPSRSPSTLPPCGHP